MQFVYLSSVLSHNGAEKRSSVPQQVALQKIKLLKTIVSGHQSYFHEKKIEITPQQTEKQACTFLSKSSTIMAQICPMLVL